MIIPRISFLCLSLSSTTSLTNSLSVQSKISTKAFSALMMSSSTNSDNENKVGLSDIANSSTATATTTITRTNNNTNHDDSSKITSWREKIDISIAKSRKVRGGNFVQIATVDPLTLEPRCRTVVFRGFLKSPPSLNNNDEASTSTPSSCIMKMITDKRSNKFSEITTDSTTRKSTTNNVEMVWWFSKSNEQFRIRGKLRFVGNDERDSYLLQSRKEQWGNLSDSAREQFFWKNPGLDYESDSEVPAGGRDEDGKIIPVPDAFLLMLLYPSHSDYLRLGDNYRQVDHLIQDNWASNRVNP
mmetsp:Transcript_5749/g.7347  ORF Transcript_5749/g.7347 Transcript_5749/m.7347 type:complete len:300 (+) Transcript_5749:79-978(+)